jgi:hypothetical protein
VNNFIRLHRFADTMSQQSDFWQFNVYVSLNTFHSGFSAFTTVASNPSVYNSSEQDLEHSKISIEVLISRIAVHNLASLVSETEKAWPFIWQTRIESCLQEFHITDNWHYQPSTLEQKTEQPWHD